MKLTVLGALLLAIAPGAAAQAPLPWGYVVARDPFSGREGLVLADLAGGNVIEIGPVAADGFAALAEAPDGRLFAFDPATAELVELSPVEGAERSRTALPVPPPGAAAPCGLAFDARGRVFIACGSPAVVYELEAQRLDRAKARAALAGEVLGLAALGDGLLAFYSAPLRGIATIEPELAASVPLSGPALPDFADGDLAFDAAGRVHALDEEGALLTVDPVDGTFVRAPQLVIEAAGGLALPATPRTAYAAEDDGRGALLRIELTSGRIERLAAFAPQRAVALALARDGRMLALDDEAERVLLVDASSGAASPLAVALGFDIDGGGLAFDGQENLWLADLTGALYLVDDLEGDAELRGNLGAPVQSLAFDGARLLALSGDRMLVVDAQSAIATPLPDLLGIGSAAAVGAAANAGIFGLTRGGTLFGASGASGMALSLARLPIAAPRGFAFAPTPAGVGIANLERAELFVSRADALGAANEDSWSMQGSFPSAGLPADPTGVTVQVFLNGNPLVRPVALDRHGRFRSKPGATPELDLRVDGDGDFDLRFEGLDLAALVPFADGDARLPLVVQVELEIGNASLDEPRTRTRAVLDATARAGLDVRGSLAKSGNGAEGALAIEFATAHELADFSHRLRVRGTLRAAGGGPLEVLDDPTTERDVRVTFGDAAPLELSFDDFRQNGSKLSYVDQRRGLIGGLREIQLDLESGDFKVRTYPLADTGLPFRGAGSETAYALPFSLQVLSPGGPLEFATELDLRRKSETSLDWKRGAR